jgi:hypothetical protein
MNYSHFDPLHTISGTFKAKKTKLVDEAYNIDIINDKLYYFHAKEQMYKRLTKQIYDDICNSN